MHGLIIGAGGLAVLYVLLPGAWHRRRSLAALHHAGTPEALVALAERRAGTQFDAARSGSANTSNSGDGGLLKVAALASVAAAAIHGAVGPEHFREDLRLGLFFVALCAVQLLLAGRLVRRPSQPVVLIALLVNAGTVVLWIATRTVGLPFKLAAVESVGTLDTVASAAELTIVACCLAWLQRHVQRRRAAGSLTVGNEASGPAMVTRLSPSEKGV
jgi:hypothetical protein